jgi:pyruvate dehydrogenase (quinone)
MSGFQDKGDTPLSKCSLLCPISTERFREQHHRARPRADTDIRQTITEAQAMVGADPINPQRVFYELSPKFPDNAIITADSGITADWYSRYSK